MPRPRKWRRVCCLPESRRFGPLDAHARADDAVTMTVDEYETIRLMDQNGLTQEQCAEQMSVSRTTVQGIYDSARKKLAQFLVDGKILRIEGGEYRLCGRSGQGCCGAGCRRRRCGGWTENTEKEPEDSHENYNSHE